MSRGNGGPRRVVRSRTPAGTALHVAHLRACRHWSLRQRRLASAERLQSLVERADLVLVQIARQLEQVAVELAQRHLALAVAHHHVVDRGVAGEASDLLLLLHDQAADAVRSALADEDDAGP